ncbi:hypothetical protein O6H91_05G094300 [Diphasiastrum complanatum]|uniref:Uncharacterized protein n=1 Tax=Diphasiastrum complanatum TaxID=34168 RepID=A0ACC2DR18_DIPCM|nr:hypothetical protein O6H91_05G094300 [Diphasiastrum complanatum]
MDFGVFFICVCVCVCVCWVVFLIGFGACLNGRFMEGWFGQGCGFMGWCFFFCFCFLVCGLLGHFFLWCVHVAKKGVGGLDKKKKILFLLYIFTYILERLLVLIILLETKRLSMCFLAQNWDGWLVCNTVLVFMY